ncbi:DUF5069 domain-containing protein [Cerasicoccus fimbriatus]|uniref:DUF5069 domain-containing protein n=1 Tax=Cerasicoccus fimbriatus TaxID=3014554 RepID=UPI0022B440B8|nr:DUF5069 domain-containing protein [Cerasicoccus sp. TK19100]
MTTNTDLTTRPPRSPRVRLGGFAHLPRLIDKARAQTSQTLGVYEYGDASLLDREFFRFIGITADALLAEVSRGGGDLSILQWVLTNATRSLLPHEIAAWSHWIENVPGLSTEARAWFAEFSASLEPPRPDVSTLFEYLDVDDYVRFGGQA